MLLANEKKILEKLPCFQWIKMLKI
jgi:hypothetical protein